MYEAARVVLPEPGSPDIHITECRRYRQILSNNRVLLNTV
jgi:hypothetical protein